MEDLLKEETNKRLVEAYMLVLEKGSEAYQKVFNALAQKYGVKPEDVNNLPTDKKKAFFDELDKKWKSDKEKEGVDEAKGTDMKCMECGHKFRKQIGKNTTEVKCPKCKGYDTDVA